MKGNKAILSKNDIIDIITSCVYNVIPKHLDKQYSKIDIRVDSSGFLIVDIFDVPAKYAADNDLLDTISSDLMSQIINTINQQVGKDFNKLYHIASKIIIVHTNPEEIRKETGQIPSKITYTITLPDIK